MLSIDTKILLYAFHLIFQNHYSNIGDIFLECRHYQLILKKTYYERDGISDYLNTCLLNFKSQKYKNILNNLLKPNFIREYDEY